MEKIVESFELYGKQYRLETGELAKQATGSVVVTQGDTTVLVTAVISKEEKDYDFFPLTVDFIEKMYAVGRIPGGYLKREARPSDKGTLTARMVDRPIRPGFADGFKREVHVVCTTLVVDSINPPDTICVMGASAALMLGAAPFDGPAACVRIGRDVETGEFIVNPTFEESENSDLELTIAGTADYISMVEAGADEISEEDMLAAMTFGQEAIAAFCEAQQRFLDRANIEPVEWPVHVADPAIAERVAPFMAEMSAALRDADKLSRMGKVEELKARIKEEQFSDEERAAMTRLLSSGFTDTFRLLHPEAEGAYSWGSYRFKAREKNAGWRIDYFIVSQRLGGRVAQASIHPDIQGSDHCPISLVLK